MSLRNSLQRLIRLDGVWARTFACAEDFLNTRDRHHIRCLFLDAGLPGMNGLELHSWLKTDDAGIPIIVISAGQEPEVRKLALLARVYASLIGPFTAFILVDAIHNVLKRPPHKSGSHSART